MTAYKALRDLNLHFKVHNTTKSIFFLLRITDSIQSCSLHTFLDASGKARKASGMMRHNRYYWSSTMITAPTIQSSP